MRYNNAVNARVSIIAAVGKNRAIGKGGTLLWRISDDLKRFKALTTGHVIIMGRKTFESIGRALPNRTNIVMTHNADFKAEGAVAARSLEEAVQIAQQETDTPPKEIFIIGGGEIYRQALLLADKLCLTLVESDAEGDVFFPDWTKHFIRETFREERVDPARGLKYAWVDLERAT